jgi:hypothetical protein
MALESVARPGPYEIPRPLGAGGTRKVHRARDTRLERDLVGKLTEEPFPSMLPVEWTPEGSCDLTSSSSPDAGHHSLGFGARWEMTVTF